MSLRHYYGREPVVHTHDAHGLNDAAMRAMFAKMGNAISPGNRGAVGGKIRDASRASLPNVSKPAPPVGARPVAKGAAPKGPGAVKKMAPPQQKQLKAGGHVSAKQMVPKALPKAKAPAGPVKTSTQHAPKAHAPKAGHAPGGGHAGGHKGHGPFADLLHTTHRGESAVGKTVARAKAAVGAVAQGTIAATGQEPVAGALKKQLAGHHFGITHSYGETYQGY